MIFLQFTDKDTRSTRNILITKSGGLKVPFISAWSFYFLSAECLQTVTRCVAFINVAKFTASDLVRVTRLHSLCSLFLEPITGRKVIYYYFHLLSYVRKHFQDFYNSLFAGTHLILSGKGRSKETKQRVFISCITPHPETTINGNWKKTNPLNAIRNFPWLLFLLSPSFI